MRSSYATAMVLVLAATTLAAVPGTEAEADACQVTRVEEFDAGVPGGWTVDTPVNDSGTATWQGRDNQVSGGNYLHTDGSGVGAKDDRLVSAPIRPDVDAVMEVYHEWVLGPGAGGLLEVSTDGGATWSPVPPEAVTNGGYTGSVGGRPAWTGARPAVWGNDGATPASGVLTTVSLEQYAGQDIRLAWRLLQPEASGAPGGGWGLVAATFRRLVDPRCEESAPASVRCRTTLEHSPRETLPDGWRVETPRNDNGTATWSPEPFLTPFGIVRGGVTTDASGLAEKDDRLIVPVVPSSRTVVGFSHAYHLEAGRDGGVVEISTDSGDTWVDAGDRLRHDGYDGTLGDGRGAFTGDSYDPANRVPPVLRLRSTGVWLGDLAGSEVLVRWRLLQDEQSVTSLPGRRWQLRSLSFRDVLDPACLAGGAVPTDDDSDDAPITCGDLTPAAAGVEGVTDDGARRTLDVRVAFDLEESVEIARLARDPETTAEARARFEDLVAERAPDFEPAAATFEPLGIDLELSYELVDPLDHNDEVRPRVETTHDLLARLKQQHGGTPPAGIDAVYAVTDADLTDAVGRADCVGGIRFDDRSFAVGEQWPEEPAHYFGIGESYDVTAKIMAHEVSHLLGAHHHFANCAEGVLSQPVEESTTVCTLMFSDPPFLSENLSTANGTVVRGYATSYLDS